MTDLYAVFGNPLSHTKSPLIHRAFAAQTQQDLDYIAIESPLDGFAADVEARDVLQPDERDAVVVARARERADLRDAGAIQDARRALLVRMFWIADEPGRTIPAYGPPASPRSSTRKSEPEVGPEAWNAT